MHLQVAVLCPQEATPFHEKCQKRPLPSGLGATLVTHFVTEQVRYFAFSGHRRT